MFLTPCGCKMKARRPQGRRWCQRNLSLSCAGGLGWWWWWWWMMDDDDGDDDDGDNDDADDDENAAVTDLRPSLHRVPSDYDFPPPPISQSHRTHRPTRRYFTSSFVHRSIFGSSANRFFHRPFPFLTDWFHGLLDLLMFLLCSAAGFVCMVC